MHINFKALVILTVLALLIFALFTANTANAKTEKVYIIESYKVSKSGPPIILFDLSDGYRCVFIAFKGAYDINLGKATGGGMSCYPKPKNE